MEQSELLMDLWELFVKQLEEKKRTHCAVMVIGFAVDELGQMSQMEEESGGGRARSI